MHSDRAVTPKSSADCQQDRAACSTAHPSSLPTGVQIETTREVLACAHFDHDPQNNAPKNLKALCQRCHILHDKDEYLRQRQFTYRLRKFLGDLFLGSYPFQY